MNDLKERTLRGGFAKICSQAASFVLRIGSLMVMARLLDPKDFGLVGMVTVVTGVFGLFRDAGLSMATVQRDTISHEQVSTLFWINLLVGGVLALASVAMAPVLVAFYHEPRIFWVTVPLAAGFIFNAAGVQHSALLQRQMRFGALAAIEVIALVISIALGIGMAMSGFGYWALVVMTVSQPLAATICVWLVTAWYPGLPSRGAGVLSMIRFGGGVTFNSLVVYVAYNVDKILLGRLWGAEALGVYGRAYQLVNIPTENLNSAVGGVAVSALSRLQNDPSRFKSYFLKGYALVLVLTIPLTAAFALFAGDIIFVLLGQKWRNTVPIFRFLAPTIMAFALINPLSWLLFSSGQIKRSVKMALVIAPLVIASYVAGLPYGPNGVALGYSAMMTLLVVPMIAWAIHGSIISPRDIWKAVSPPLLSAVVASAVSLGFRLFWRQWIVTPLPRLVLECGVLASVYMTVLLFVMGQKRFYFDVIRDFRRRSGQEAPAAIQGLA